MKRALWILSCFVFLGGACLISHNETQRLKQEQIAHNKAEHTHFLAEAKKLQDNGPWFIKEVDSVHGVSQEKRIHWRTYVIERPDGKRAIFPVNNNERNYEEYLRIVRDDYVRFRVASIKPPLRCLEPFSHYVIPERIKESTPVRP